MEFKFQKHGCPWSRNTTTGELLKSGQLREQPSGTEWIQMHQSQLFKTSQSQWSIRFRVTCRLNLLMKASSMQSKPRDIQPKWVHCETKYNTLFFITLLLGVVLAVVYVQGPYVHTTRKEFQERLITPAFWICVGGKLGQGNHIIMWRLICEKFRFLKRSPSRRKCKAGVMKFFRF